MIVKIEIPDDAASQLAKAHGTITGMAETIEKKIGHGKALPVRESANFLQKLMEAVDEAKPVTE